MNHSPRQPGGADRRPGVLGALERWGTAAENALLVLLLGIMMIVAVGQIVLRLFFNSGFIWADELLKILVLWVALVASIAASRSGRHLRIDILSHFVAPRFARLPGIAVDAFTAGVCGVIAWHSARYVQLAVEFQDTVLVDVPAWLVHGLLPVAFLLMCYRYALSAFAGLADLVRARSQPRGQAG